MFYEEFFPHKTPPAGADGGLPGKFLPDTCSPTHTTSVRRAPRRREPYIPDATISQQPKPHNAVRTGCVGRAGHCLKKGRVSRHDERLSCPLMNHTICIYGGQCAGFYLVAGAKFATAAIS